MAAKTTIGVALVGAFTPIALIVFRVMFHYPFPESFKQVDCMRL